MMIGTVQITDLILHQASGLREYKYAHSHLKPVGHQEQMKGTIFTFRSKSNMKKSLGVVITSLEALNENQDQFTHWTPNVYRYGTYVDDKKRFVKGHSETNLKQINTFVVDIDNKTAGYDQLLLKSLDLGFMPTLILETKRGFQMYFVLKKPAYVTAKTNFKVIEVAKKISQTLRAFFSDSFAVDLGCNHFGIARIPRSDNVVFCDPDYCYGFQEWLNWSLKRADDFAQETPKLSLVESYKGPRQIDEPWFDLLLHQGQIKGSKGLLGRNNAVLTLALAFYSSGKNQENCLYNLTEFNGRLEVPLTDAELRKTIASAYSGKYQAANRDYILSLVHQWVNPELKIEELFHFRRGWHKFAKPRSQRTYSHYAEREADLMNYLLAHTTPNGPLLKIKQRELSEELGISGTTMRAMKKRLQQAGTVYFGATKRGPNGYLTLAAKSMLVVALLQRKQESDARKQAYVAYLAQLLNCEEAQLSEELAAPLTIRFTQERLDLSVVNAP